MEESMDCLEAMSLVLAVAEAGSRRPRSVA